MTWAYDISYVQTVLWNMHYSIDIDNWNSHTPIILELLKNLVDSAEILHSVGDSDTAVHAMVHATLLLHFKYGRVSINGSLILARY